MPRMYRGEQMKDLKEVLTECGAIMHGEFTLASGENSRYYIDIKRASTDPEVLGIIAQAMCRESEDIDHDVIGGVVLGSVPLAVALSLVTGNRYVMVRKERKDHGTSRLVEGDLSPGARVLVVEDVITSGGSVVAAIETLRSQGAVVEDVLAVIDRQSGGQERLWGVGVRLHALIRAEDIVDDP